MGSKRAKMTREERAKQFMPFDALKGFREALVEKEREHMKAIEKGSHMQAGSQGETSVHRL